MLVAQRARSSASCSTSWLVGVVAVATTLVGASEIPVTRKTFGAARLRLPDDPVAIAARLLETQQELHVDAAAVEQRRSRGHAGDRHAAIESAAVWLLSTLDCSSVVPRTVTTDPLVSATMVEPEYQRDAGR